MARYVQRYPEILTPEREAMVMDAIELVQVTFASAGQTKDEVALAIRIPDQIQMLRSRGVLTEIQELAAKQLQDCFYASGLGGVPSMPMGQDFVDKSPMHDETMVARMDKVDTYIWAIRSIPRPTWPVIKAVVLEGKPIAFMVLGVRRNRGALRARAIVHLQTGLEELADHFGLESRKRRPHRWRARGNQQ